MKAVYVLLIALLVVAEVAVQKANATIIIKGRYKKKHGGHSGYGSSGGYGEGYSSYAGYMGRRGYGGGGGYIAGGYGGDGGYNAGGYASYGAYSGRYIGRHRTFHWQYDRCKCMKKCPKGKFYIGKCKICRKCRLVMCCTRRRPKKGLG